MFRSFIIAAASAAVLTFSATAFAQKPDHGTADEAKAMLMKAVAALKADKQKTLDLINEGEGGGFFDRDLYVFCANVGDGKAVALGNPFAWRWNSNARQLLGVDTRTLKDSTGKAFGQDDLPVSAHIRLYALSLRSPLRWLRWLRWDVWSMREKWQVNL
jgi:hypothetical protein